MTEETFPSVLNDDNYAPAEPSEQVAPSVSLSLVEHLKATFPREPIQYVPGVSMAETALKWASHEDGQHEVIAYLEQLVRNQQGDQHELPSSQAEDQPTGSRAPGPRSRR